MPDITDYEAAQVGQANASGLTPVVFIHGLWLLPSSWDRWRTFFEEAGYATLAPGWPDDPSTVEEANEHPAIMARKTIGQIADHFHEVTGGLTRKPALIGHSFGGLLTQILAGRGVAAVSVAIDPAPFRGVLPLPISALKSATPPTAAAPSRSPTTSSGSHSPTPSPRRRRRNCTPPLPCQVRACRFSRRRPPTSTRGPKPKSTLRIPTAGRCSSSMASTTTPCPGLSPTPPTSGRSATRT